MTLVYCGSFASVHSHKLASPSRMSASRPTSLHRSFSGASLQAQSCVRVPNPLFDDRCTNRSELVSIRAVGNSLTGLLGVALQPARVPLHSVPVVPTRENTPRLSWVCDCWPCMCGEPSAFQSQCCCSESGIQTPTVRTGKKSTHAEL